MASANIHDDPVTRQRAKRSGTSPGEEEGSSPKRFCSSLSDGDHSNPPGPPGDQPPMRQPMNVVCQSTTGFGSPVSPGIPIPVPTTMNNPVRVTPEVGPIGFSSLGQGGTNDSFQMFHHELRRLPTNLSPSPEQNVHHPPNSPDPAVLELIGLQVTDKLTSAYIPPCTFSDTPLTHCTADYVAETTIDAVDTALGYQSTAWNRTASGGRRVPFKRFVRDVIRRASVKTPVLLTTLVYIGRAKSHLHIESEDWACERVFMGALMVASKVCSHFFDICHSADHIPRSIPTIAH